MSLRGNASLRSRGTPNLAAVHRMAATQYTEAWEGGKGGQCDPGCQRGNKEQAPRVVTSPGARECHPDLSPGPDLEFTQQSAPPWGSGESHVNTA